MVAGRVCQGRPGRRRRMFPPVAIALAACVLLAACYVGGPLVTLWRLARALDSGDLAALESLVDWDAVRQGLKDDIAEGIIGMPEKTLLASNTLPPFGASFISGIAGAEVDQSVTPQGLVEATRQFDPSAPAGKPDAAIPAILQAGFSSPTEFDLHVRAACQDADEAPLHVRLEFRSGRWQVVRIWIPQDLMDRAASRT